MEGNNPAVPAQCLLFLSLPSKALVPPSELGAQRAHRRSENIPRPQTWGRGDGVPGSQRRWALLRAGCLSSGKEINFQQKIKGRNTSRKQWGRLEAVIFKKK